MVGFGQKVDTVLRLLMWSLLQVIGEHESSLKRALDEFGVYLKPSAYGQDVKPLLKETCKSIFGSSAGLVDMMVQHFPSSKEGNARKVSLIR